MARERSGAPALQNVYAQQKMSNTMKTST